MVDHRNTGRGLWLAGLALAALAALGQRATAADIATPISLTGWNADVVTDANPATRFAQQFDFGSITGGLSSWYQSGIVFNGVPQTHGLPTGTNITSQINNTVTGTPTVFALLPANGNNVLRLSRDPRINVPSATLTLTTPGQYSSLAVLASTGAAFSPASGVLTLNFSDGTTPQFNYDAPDWNVVVANDPTHLAIAPVDRNDDINFNGAPPGTGFLPEGNPQFGLFETDLNLAALGLDTKTLTSITFTPANALFSGAITGVFAVSGVPVAAPPPPPPPGVPEPSSLALLGLGGIALAAWRRRRGRE
jgi:hypothetical protein